MSFKADVRNAFRDAVTQCNFEVNFKEPFFALVAALAVGGVAGYFTFVAASANSKDSIAKIVETDTSLAAIQIDVNEQGWHPELQPGPGVTVPEALLLTDADNSSSIKNFIHRGIQTGQTTLQVQPAYAKAVAKNIVNMRSLNAQDLQDTKAQNIRYAVAASGVVSYGLVEMYGSQLFTNYIIPGVLTPFYIPAARRRRSATQIPQGPQPA